MSNGHGEPPRDERGSATACCDSVSKAPSKALPLAPRAARAVDRAGPALQQASQPPLAYHTGNCPLGLQPTRLCPATRCWERAAKAGPPQSPPAPGWRAAGRRRALWAASWSPTSPLAQQLAAGESRRNRTTRWQTTLCGTRCVAGGCRSSCGELRDGAAVGAFDLPDVGVAPTAGRRHIFLTTRHAGWQA